jgi:hypothetical protein
VLGTFYQNFIVQQSGNAAAGDKLKEGAAHPPRTDEAAHEPLGLQKRQ